MPRWTPITLVLSIAATAGIVVWALVGMPGGPATCVAADVCDCEAVGLEAIRQPVNAWSSLALVMAGLWVIATGSIRSIGWDRALGVSIIVSGLAAFATHSSVSAWAHQLDGAAIVLLVTVLALHEWAPSTPASGAFAFGIAAAAVATPFGSAGTNTAAIAIGACFLAAQWTRIRNRRTTWALAAAVLFGLGAGLRALGDSGGPWCDPVSLLQGHGAWHVLAAAGYSSLIGYLRSGPSPGGHRV